MKSVCLTLTLVLCGGLGSCKKSGTRPDRVAPQPPPPAPSIPQNGNDQEPKSPATSSDERADPPSNIAGILLYVHCSFEVFANDKSQESLLGCRIDDSAGKRRPAASLAPNFTYDHKLPEFADLKIFPRILDRDSRYDVLYLLQGKPTLEMARQVAKMVINAVLKGTDAQKDIVVEGVLANILRNANALPEQRDADYAKAVQQILDDAKEGIATPLVLDPLPQNPAEKGERLYATLCASCHGNKGEGAPLAIKDGSVAGIQNALTTVPLMKTVANIVNEDDIAAISSYLKP